MAILGHMAIGPYAKKIAAKCRLWVYNAEIFFVASGHPFAPVIRPTKRNSKKVYFWDTLMIMNKKKKGRIVSKKNKVE